MRKLKGYIVNLEMFRGGVLGNEEEMADAEVNNMLRTAGTPLNATVQDMRREIDRIMENAREIHTELDQYEQEMPNYENIRFISETEVPDPGGYDSLEVELNDVIEMISDLKRGIREELNDSRNSFEVSKKRFLKDLASYIRSPRNGNDYLQDLLIQIQDMIQNHDGAARYLRAVEIKLERTGNSIIARQLFDSTYV